MRARAWDCAVYRKRCRAVNTNKAADRKFLQLSEKMVRWCGFLLVLGASLQAAGCMGTKQLELSVGHVFILNCSNFYGDEVISVNWTREPNQDWDAGIKVINQSLWFFPVQESHSGKYSCYFSDKDGPFEMNFSISVSKSKCPQVASSVVLMTNRLGHLNCGIKGLREIGKLNPSKMGWTWMKDCSPLSWHEQSDKLRFTRVSNGDKGVYTCFLNFSHNGTSYIMAQSMQVMITDPDPVPQKPRVIKPRQETLEVKLGSTQVLNCKVFVGSGSCTMEHVETISPYWLVNGMFVEHYRNHFNTHNGCTTEDNVEYRHSTLTIFEARQEFFNIPFQCVVHSSLGYDNGTVILIQYRHRELYCTLAVFTAFAVVALGFLLFYQFKVDLVLAYRNLSPCLKPQNDGKLYDAYVSYLHGDDHSVPFATTFALHVLPEVLEDRLGYKLFISGRDALPGAAVHDVISETVGKSRRLIIVLPSQPFTKSSDSEMKGRLLNKMPPQHLSLNNNITATDPDLSESSRLNWGPYECLVGLYDALVKESLKVILVQVGGEVDDALLPESLRYVRHTQGILKWKQHYTREPNGRFWKQMRYRMPPVQKTRTAVMV